MIVEDFNQIKNSSIDWNRFENKTILITGANGFLPAYMVETLLLLNNDILKYSPCKVIALVRNEKHTKERFSNYLSDENLKIIVQDVANEINLIEKIDYIVHAASPASPKYYNIDPVGVIMPNILGTKNTLELARKNNIEGYLYFSSGEVYGQLNDDEVVNEDKYFQESISSSAITSSINTYRFYPKGAIFDVNFRSIFFDTKINQFYFLSFLNSKTVNQLLKILSPTMALNKKDLERLPIVFPKQ